MRKSNQLMKRMDDPPYVFTVNPMGLASLNLKMAVNSIEETKDISQRKRTTFILKVAKEMEGQEQQNKSRVVKVDSVESWDFYVAQATNQGCPIVVHFTAAWCIPSVVMNPFFEELASTYQDVLFLTVDVDDVQDVAKRMEVKAMPTFVLMRGGAAIDKLVGANPEEIRKRVNGFVQSIRVV